MLHRINIFFLLLQGSTEGAVNLDLLAWLLFLLCGIIYLIAAVRDRDMLMVAGSVCFIIAVVIFLRPDRK